MTNKKNDMHGSVNTNVAGFNERTWNADAKMVNNATKKHKNKAWNIQRNICELEGF